MVIFFLSLFICAVLNAHGEISIQSNEINYQDNVLHLNGDIHVKQMLGDIRADRAVILSSEQKMPSLIELEGNIHIDTKDRGYLSAQKGNIDCNSLRATFLGSDLIPQVTYTHEYTSPKHTQKTPLSIESKGMTMSFKLDEKKHVLDALEAENEVIAHYNQEYKVNAKRARYDHSKGKLYLYANEDKSLLVEVHYFNDQVTSEFAEVDTQKQELTFSKARGTLKNQIEVSADRIIWNDKDHYLRLESNVYIKQQGIGDLTTPHSVLLIHNLKEGKKEIRAIEADGEITLTYVDNKKGFTHLLECPGPLKIDHEKYQVFLQSTDTVHQKIPSENQVHFSNMMGDIYADQAWLSYKWENEQAVPFYLHMEGHVKLINKFIGHEKEVGMDLQNVLADSLDYFIDKREMHLSAHSPNRVLLFDRVKNMQMSAPAFIMTFDETLTKPTVRGIGQTRLKFAERELQQMKHYFNLKDTP